MLYDNVHIPLVMCLRRKRRKQNQEWKVRAAKAGTEAKETPSTIEQMIVEIKGTLKKGSKPSELGSFLVSLTESYQEKTNALFQALF